MRWTRAVVLVAMACAGGASAQDAGVRVVRTDAGELVIEHEGPGRVVFTLDGSEPGPASHAYAEPLPLPGPAVVRAAVVGEGGEVGAVTEARFDVPRTAWEVSQTGASPDGPSWARTSLRFGGALLVRGVTLEGAEGARVVRVCVREGAGAWSCRAGDELIEDAAGGVRRVLLARPAVATTLVLEVSPEGAPVDAAGVGVVTVSWDGRAEAPAGGPEGMVWVPGGWFGMGSDDQEPVEGPRHPVWVDGFWMDAHEVTNDEFAAFVEATGYETVAERPLDPAAFPGVDPSMLQPGAMVFRSPPAGASVGSYFDWWSWVPGACWRRPLGPGSTVEGMGDHPVVHVAWEDARAYAAWAGKDLPTEAEWERAARGGHEGRTFVWGEEMNPGGEHPANVWQGEFPREQLASDGFAGTAPVGSFPPNGFGLFDMAGNVWEWCADWYRPDTYRRPYGVNPAGPAEADSFDPREPGMAKRVMRGGSFLCAENYCVRYRPSARTASTPDSGMSHVGFRCVVRR